MKTNVKLKDPVIAAVLNFVPGLGYLYAGVRTRFGGILFASSVMMIIVLFDPSLSEQPAETDEELTIGTLAALAWMILFFGAFVYDAYGETKALNQKLLKKRK